MSKAIQFRLTAATHVGCVRTNNEDNFIVCPDLTQQQWVIPAAEDTLSLGPFGTLLVVADGMGGMNAGEVASSIAVDSIKAYFTEQLASMSGTISEESAKNMLLSSVKFADRQILQHADAHPETEGMGTTVVMIWLLDGKAHVCWCGDSRAYSWHPARGLKQLSKDHSYVQELVDSGKLDPSLAFDHPESNIITRSLGNKERPAQADVETFAIHKDESFLLCSDGLSGMLRDSEMAAVLSQNPSLQETKSALIQAALDAGGYDNLTLVLCTVVSGGEEMGADEVDKSSISRSRFTKARRLNVILGAAIAVLLLIGGGGFFLYNRHSRSRNHEKVTLEMSRHTLVLKQKEVETDSVLVRCSRPWSVSGKDDWLHLFHKDSVLTISLYMPRLPKTPDSTLVIVRSGRETDTLKVYYHPASATLPSSRPALRQAPAKEEKAPVKVEEAPALRPENTPAEEDTDDLTEMPVAESEDGELTEAE